jgi:hypothetical protein
MKRMEIVEINGIQTYKSDWSVCETIALLEIWKYKLIQEQLKKKRKNK